MGYYVNITRRTIWDDDEEQDDDITPEEWQDYINNDAELKPQPEDKYSCEWSAYPGEYKPYFDYYKGTISVKNPDDEIITKMLLIAETLNAKVQGEQGEIYDFGDDANIIYKYPEEEKPPAATTATKAAYLPPVVKKPWWKFW